MAVGQLMCVFVRLCRTYFSICKHEWVSKRGVNDTRFYTLFFVGLQWMLVGGAGVNVSILLVFCVIAWLCRMFLEVDANYR